MNENFKNFMLSPEAGAFLQVLSGVIEKAFDCADRKDQRRHEERVEQLKIQRLEAEARAEKLRAEAEQIRSRAVSASFTHNRVKKNA